MRCTHRSLSAVPSLIFAALMGYPAVADAGLAAGAEMNVGIPTHAPLDGVGTGFAGRLGYRLGLGPIAVTPEAGLGHVQLDKGHSPTRLVVGGRVSVRGLLEPSLYGHYGYAWVGSGLRGPTHDVGAALDVNAAIVRFGAHASLVAVEGRRDQAGWSRVEPMTWVELGLHAGLGF